MKMIDMARYFEERGFEVEYKYHQKKGPGYSSNDGYYTFTISRDKNHLCRQYQWPENQTWFMDRN